MSNVRFDCPEETCGTRAYLPDGNPDHLRCPQHQELYVQTEESPGSVLTPEERDSMTEPVVQMQQPTSVDAVTNDGRVVGDVVGIPSPGHGQGVNQLPVEQSAVNKEAAAKSKSSSKAGSK